MAPSARIARRAAALALASASAAACTLFSGWSELQNGTPAARDAAPEGALPVPDASSIDATFSDFDAATAEDRALPPGTCSVRACRPAPCCLHQVTHQNVCAASCSGGGDIAFYCTDETTCVGSPGGPVCCMNAELTRATCVQTCDAFELCSDVSGCKNGVACSPFLGNLKTCQ